MFQVLTNVQSEEAVSLQQNIDNREANLCVGLRSLTWWVGWWNWQGGEAFQWRQRGGRPINCIIPPGLYPEEDIASRLSQANPGFQLNTGEHDGNVSLTVPTGHEVKLSDPLRQLYGLDDEGWLDAGLYTGDRPVNFLPSKTIGLRLHQLNTTANVVDGAPSNILACFEAQCLKFGKAWSIHFSNPEMKPLQGGTLTELKVELVDTLGRKINNHGLSVQVTLEIKKS